jgi:hypothetical protein
MKETGPSCEWPGISSGLRFESSGIGVEVLVEAFAAKNGGRS